VLASKMKTPLQALVAHACNPSYSGSRRSGGWRFKASQGKQFIRPYFKKGLVQAPAPPPKKKNKEKKKKTPFRIEY
jgi:hypothetical protein